MCEKVGLALGILKFARVSGSQKTSKKHHGSTFFPQTGKRLERVTKKTQSCPQKGNTKGTQNNNKNIPEAHQEKNYKKTPPKVNFYKPFMTSEREAPFSTTRLVRKTHAQTHKHPAEHVWRGTVWLDGAHQDHSELQSPRKAEEHKGAEGTQDSEFPPKWCERPVARDQKAKENITKIPLRSLPKWC